jgi:hypothetical protein
MFFSDKLFSTRHGITAHGYAYQAMEAMRVIHNSFVIMAGKLKIALQKKLITDVEYNEWMRCFHALQNEWLAREVTTADDVLFLQWMAKSSVEEAKRFFLM